MSPLSNLLYVKERVGIIGGIKSAYYSTKYTDGPTSLIIHPNVEVDISSETIFDIDGHLYIGDGWPSSIEHSILTSSANASISQTGAGSARIYPGFRMQIFGDFSMGNSYINFGSHIRCKDAISIGDNCAISWNVEIIDYDGHQVVEDGERDSSHGPKAIEIQDHVWIGHGASINKGVTIHQGSVVANDSVVTKDVPSNTLVAGCPAEIIRENFTWE